MSTTRALIDAIASGDSVAIQSTFESAMAERIADRMDSMRQEVAQNMFKEASCPSMKKKVKEEEGDDTMEEEVEAVEEEQLDELSPKTLRSYQARAQDDKADLKDVKRDAKADMKHDPENASFHKDTADRADMYIKRRDKGLAMAKKKLS